MTTVHRLLPEVAIRDGRKPRPPANRVRQLDHWEMLMDRASGMTWAAIEKKHQVKRHAKLRPGETARHRLAHSATLRKLSPEHVGSINFGPDPL